MDESGRKLSKRNKDASLSYLIDDLGLSAEDVYKRQNQNSRDGAMAQIISLNIIFISFYCLAIAITPIVSFI